MTSLSDFGELRSNKNSIILVYYTIFYRCRTRSCVAPGPICVPVYMVVVVRHHSRTATVGGRGQAVFSPAPRLRRPLHC